MGEQKARQKYSKLGCGQLSSDNGHLVKVFTRSLFFRGLLSFSCVLGRGSQHNWLPFSRSDRQEDAEKDHARGEDKREQKKGNEEMKSNA